MDADPRPPSSEDVRATIARAAAYWDGVAEMNEALRAWRGEAPAATAADDDEAARLASLLPPGGTLLDIGCGDGRIAARLAPRAGVLIAYDVSAGMRAAAARRLAAFPRAEVRATDGLALDAPDGSADVALLLHVAEFAPEAVVAALCAETARALKPGGLAVLHFAADDDAGRAVRALHGAPDAARAAACADEAAVRRRCAAAGLRAVEIVRAGAAWRVVSARATPDAARPTAEGCRASSIPSPGTSPAEA